MADSPTFEDLQNITIVMFILTFFVTLYRCYARYTKKLWWHDDSVALFSMLSFTIFLIGAIYLAQETPSPEVRTIGTYILAVGFFTPIWGARISIVLTVVRITPWKLQKTILLWVAAFFFLQFAIVTTETFWVCELTYTGWKQIPGAICRVPRVVPISLVVTTVVSDVTLITAPLMIVRGVSIRALRFRLFFIFSMSIATALASLTHAVMVMVRPGVWEAIFGGVGAAVSIAVSSMSVIIPAIFRALSVGDPFMQEDTVDPTISTDVEIVRMTSTMFELGLPTSRGMGTTGSAESEGTIGTVSSRQRDPVGLDVKVDRGRRLMTQISDVSLGGLGSTKVALPVDESDITDSLAQARSIPAVKTDQDVEADVKERDAKRIST